MACSSAYVVEALEAARAFEAQPAGESASQRCTPWEAPNAPVQGSPAGPGISSTVETVRRYSVGFSTVEVVTGEAADLIVPLKAVAQVDRIFSSDGDIEAARRPFGLAKAISR